MLLHRAGGYVTVLHRRIPAAAALPGGTILAAGKKRMRRWINRQGCQVLIPNQYQPVIFSTFIIEIERSGNGETD